MQKKQRGQEDENLHCPHQNDYAKFIKPSQYKPKTLAPILMFILNNLGDICMGL